MPEGHTLHRQARLQQRALGGRVVRAWSPQGRFADGAAVLDGHRLERVTAHGKHLFHTFEHVVLHVHLGLVGVFRLVTEADGPPPTAGTRLSLAADGVRVDLAGATTVELTTREGMRAVRARLGPDPLARRPDPSRFAAALARRRAPIGQVLLDQAVVAGIGNVYRAELLFLRGIHPDRPADRLTPAEVEGLWQETVTQLRHGLRLGRIVTVDPAEVGRSRRGALPDDLRLYVYKREGQPCRRCGTPIDSWLLGGRLTWACPRCQR